MKKVFTVIIALLVIYLAMKMSYGFGMPFMGY